LLNLAAAIPNMNISIRSFAKWAGTVPGSFFALAVGIHAQEVTPPIPAGATQTNAQDVASYKKMSLEQLLDQEVTSVSKQPQTYAQAPAAVEVITGEEINRSGATSIPEALRLADNLDVAQVDAHQWAISARGFNSHLGNDLLVLIDGRSVYTPLYGGVIWEAQDYLLEDIDRIEVISGPGGTLWGANAVNGVINITSKNAKDTQGGYVEAGGGTELQDFTGARYGGMLSSNVYYRVYGKYYDLGDEQLEGAGPAADSARQGQGGFRIDTEPSLPSVLTLQGDAYGGNDNLQTGDERVGGGNLLGRWSHTVSIDSDLSVQAYYDRTHLDYPYGGGLGTLSDDLDTGDVEFQDNFGWGERHKFVWGLGYRFTHEVDQGARQVLFLPSTLDQDLYDGFLQDDVKVLDEVTLTLGSKLEHNDYTGFEFEPNVRLQWNPTAKQMVWAAVSRAVRTPSRLDRGLDIPTFLPPPVQTYEAGSPETVAETLIAYELGWRAALSSKISASVSTFYNDYNDLRSLSPGPADHFFLPYTYANNDEGDTYGMELSSDYQILDWWRLHGGYDLLKENIYVKPGELDVDKALDDTSDPQSQVFLRSAMDLPARTALDVGCRWIDSLRTDSSGVPGTVPAYAEMDVRLGWQATKNLEFSIVGQNLLHDQHVEYGFQGPGTPREEIARSVYAKIAWRF
jgi:iron complex outermembrane receptor protein